MWLDTERPQLPREVIDVASLWAVLSEDACFESGWPPERLRCELPTDCRVHGNLNGLAQALENGLRNAIRHSPPDGTIRLGAQRGDEYWQLWLEDEGGGVDPAQLEAIFRPFTRLSSARPGARASAWGWPSPGAPCAHRAVTCGRRTARGACACACVWQMYSL